MPSPKAGDVDQFERFLFYRGLGDFQLPLAAVVTKDVHLTNRDAKLELGGLILMKVTTEGAGFVELGNLPAGQDVHGVIPEASSSHAVFAAALKEKLAARLVGTGLYADEAQAMVDTWERSYFHTPGLRLLYLLPQAQTDALIPLHITPTPTTLLRAMVIRVELLTPQDEQALVSHLIDFDASWFRSKGRFAEPLLQRALQLHPSQQGGALLAEINRQRRWAPLALE